MYDLVLKGGRVIDPAQGIDRVTDVAFAAGRVARIGDGSITWARKPWKLPGPALPASTNVVTEPLRARGSAATPSDVPPQ